MLSTPLAPLTLAGPFLIGLFMLVAANFMIVEFVAARAIGHHVHDQAETVASLWIAAGHSLLRLVEAALLALPYLFVYRHRLFDFDQASAPALIGLFLGVEFLYYWQHRASHRIAWFWATHSV